MAVVNPRKLIDPDSRYLGIFPPNEESVSEFADSFTSIMRKAGLPDFSEGWQATRIDLCVNLVLHPAKNRTRSWAGFPHGCVIVLDGRQPACVLCLALRKSRSKPKSAF